MGLWLLLLLLDEEDEKPAAPLLILPWPVEGGTYHFDNRVFPCRFWSRKKRIIVWWLLFCCAARDEISPTGLGPRSNASHGYVNSCVLLFLPNDERRFACNDDYSRVLRLAIRAGANIQVLTFDLFDDDINDDVNSRRANTKAAKKKKKKKRWIWTSREIHGTHDVKFDNLLKNLARMDGK